MILVRRPCWLVIFLFSLLAFRLARADEALEKKVLDDIRAENPDAVPVYEKAVATLEDGSSDEARRLFQRVTELAPNSDHAYRRLCRIELIFDDLRAAAVPHCRRALSLRHAPENHAMLARALVEAPTPLRESIEEALEHATRALTAKPGDPHALNAMVRVQLARKDIEHAKSYAAQLEKAASGDPQTYGLMARIHALAGEPEEASEAFERAKELGLPAIQHASIRFAIEGPSVVWPWVVRFAWVAAVWGIGFAVLFVAGWISSQLVLRATTNVPASLLQAYRTVIWLMCAYFYVSLPILLVGVCGAAGGIVHAMHESHRRGGQLLVTVGSIAIFTVVAVFNALKVVVVPPSWEAPGQELDLRKEPKLRALLDEVAHRIGARAVDRVFLTDDDELAVNDRGAGWFGRSGERCLILGGTLLDGMSVGTFKVLLARELGQFKNEETAGGFAHAVRRSLATMTNALIRREVDRWYSPAWLFLRGFERVFARISSGAQHLQEILAEREAALAYGSASLERGMGDENDVSGLFVG